jgi:hypothetical protein
MATRPLRPGERPLIPLKGLRSGRYRYHEDGGAQLVLVNFEDGIPYAVFVDAEDEDAGLMVPVADMAGKLEYLGPR